MRQETVRAAQNAASEVSIFKAAETASPTSEVNSTSENCSAMYPAAASATRYFHNNIKGIQFSLLATVPTTEFHPTKLPCLYFVQNFLRVWGVFWAKFITGV